MTSASEPKPAGRDNAAGGPQSGATPPSTPNADMQADDAGTSDSGGAQQEDSGTDAARAMKQTSKTAAESGGAR
jgi:hypothetical protein